MDNAHRLVRDARVDNAASIRAAGKAGSTFETLSQDAFPMRDGSRADEWVGVRLP